MKLAIFLIFAAVFVSVMANDEDERRKCKCFEGFQPKKESGEWLCRGTKNYRIFLCGEEKPPVCRCIRKGKEVVMDIGETACISIEQPFDSINCKPASEWEPYLNRHPEKRIYH